MPAPDQVDLLENADDLTDDDRLVEETVKDAPDADDDLPEPDQDPNVVPVSAVDAVDTVDTRGAAR